MSDATDKNQSELESILESAEESISNLDDQIGSDETTSPAAQQSSSDNAERQIEQVSDRLDELDKQLSASGEKSQASGQIDSDKQNSSVEDMLASLSEEVNKINGDSAPDADVEKLIAAAQDQSNETKDDDDNIDDLLASLEESVNEAQANNGQEMDIDAAVDAAMGKDNSDAGGVDDVLTALEGQAEEAVTDQQADDIEQAQENEADESEPGDAEDIDSMLASLEDEVENQDQGQPAEDDIDAAVEAAMNGDSLKAQDFEDALKSLEAGEHKAETDEEATTEDDEDFNDSHSIDQTLEDMEERIEDIKSETADEAEVQDGVVNSVGYMEQTEELTPEETLEDVDSMLSAAAEGLAQGLESQSAVKQTGAIDTEIEDAFTTATRKKPNDAQEVEDLLANELDGCDKAVVAKPKKAAKAAKPAATKVRKHPNGYQHLPLHQRMILESLDAVNKPLENVISEPIKDAIGLIAIGTIVLSMVAAAVFLLAK